MITEQGTVKVRTPVTEQAIKEMNKASFVLGILYTVFGGLFTLLGIVDSVFSEDSTFAVLIFLGVFLLFLGIFLIVARNAGIKNAIKRRSELELEFFATYIILHEYDDGENLCVQKIYYNKVVRVKDTANYLFIYHASRLAVCLDKKLLSPEELNIVRGVLSTKPAPVRQQGQESGAENLALITPENNVAEEVQAASDGEAGNTDCNDDGQTM